MLKLKNGRFSFKQEVVKQVKDFLFLNYSWVYGSSTYFKYFIEMGHSCDIATESNYLEYLQNKNVEYKNIVVYLHETSQLEFINKYLDSHNDSFLIQHDDTDIEQIQNWTTRIPDLFMRREQTADTIVPNNLNVYPIHFPMQSIYQENSEKIYDVCFVGTITHGRRLEFVKKLKELASGPLSHLKWYIDSSDYPGWVPGNASSNFRSAVNQSKIGLHYFGNSYDSTRIWEILSCNTALLMPKYRVIIPEERLEDSSYEILADDFSDLQEKIEFLLKDDKWKEVAHTGQTDYNLNHTREKCCEYYYQKVMKHCAK